MNPQHSGGTGGGSPWAWFPVLALLSVSFSVRLDSFVAEGGTIYLDPSYLLPILAGWLALRFGRRAIPVIVAGAPLAMFYFSLSFFGELFVVVGAQFSLQSYVLSLVVCMAVAGLPNAMNQ